MNLTSNLNYASTLAKWGFGNHNGANPTNMLEKKPGFIMIEITPS
jgi:hypothetical protein